MFRSQRALNSQCFHLIKRHAKLMIAQQFSRSLAASFLRSVSATLMVDEDIELPKQDLLSTRKNVCN